MGYGREYYSDDASDERPRQQHPKKEFIMPAGMRLRPTLPDLHKSIKEMSNAEIQENLGDILLVIIGNLNEALKESAIYHRGIHANKSVDLHKGGSNVQGS